MADFKLLGGTDPVTSELGSMSQGIGYPLRVVDESAAGGTVTVRTETELRAGSDVTQEPVAVDTPIQLSFGPAQVNPIVSVDALGNFTFGVTDEFQVRLRLQFGRTGNPGTALIFGRALVNGVQLGDPVFTTLDDADFSIPTTFEGVVPFTAGDVLTVEIYRDSTGSNYGGVFAAVSTLWTTSPSCLMTITRTTAVTV